MSNIAQNTESNNALLIQRAREFIIFLERYGRTDFGGWLSLEDEPNENDIISAVNCALFLAFDFGEITTQAHEEYAIAGKELLLFLSGTHPAQMRRQYEERVATLQPPLEEGEIDPYRVHPDHE